MAAAATDCKILYRKAIGAEKELVVTKGPLIGADVIKPLLPSSFADRVKGCYPLSVELHSANAAPLCVWSKLFLAGSKQAYDSVRVADILFLPERMVLVTTDSESSILMRQISIFGSADYQAFLRPADWTMVQAANPPGEQLTARLSYDEKQNRVRVEVTQTLQGVAQHTLFEQKSPEWKFVRVKQWQESAATTRGTSQAR